MKKLIKTEADYEEAMERLHELMLANPDEGTLEADELELLVHLTGVYEDETVNIPAKPYRGDQIPYGATRT